MASERSSHLIGVIVGSTAPSRSNVLLRKNEGSTSFALAGMSYPSLTKVAKKITGAHSLRGRPLSNAASERSILLD
jgi:hypothetical protein